MMRNKDLNIAMDIEKSDVTSSNERVNNGKNHLSNYTYNIKRINELTLQNADYHNRIVKASRGIPQETSSVGKEFDENWKSDLYEKIESNEKDILKYELMTDIVHDFIRTLEYKDKVLIDKLYLRNMKSTYTDLHDEYGYTREGLRNYVWFLIEKKWRF